VEKLNIETHSRTRARELRTPGGGHERSKRKKKEGLLRRRGNKCELRKMGEIHSDTAALGGHGLPWGEDESEEKMR